MKYRFHIICNGKRRQLILKRHFSESEEHIALKLLAYLLFFDEHLKVEVSAGQHYKPDLLRMDGRDVTLWIDCGSIAIRKLNRVTTRNPHARIYVVKATQSEAMALKRQADKKLKHPDRVRYIFFDDGFINGVITALSSANIIEAAVNDEHGEIWLHINNMELYSRIGIS